MPAPCSGLAFFLDGLLPPPLRFLTPPPAPPLLSAADLVHPGLRTPLCASRPGMDQVLALPGLALLGLGGLIDLPLHLQAMPGGGSATSWIRSRPRIKHNPAAQLPDAVPEASKLPDPPQLPKTVPVAQQALLDTHVPMRRQHLLPL